MRRVIGILIYAVLFGRLHLAFCGVFFFLLLYISIGGTLPFFVGNVSLTYVYLFVVRRASFC